MDVSMAPFFQESLLLALATFFTLIYTVNFEHAIASQVDYSRGQMIICKQPGLQKCSET